MSQSKTNGLVATGYFATYMPANGKVKIALLVQTECKLQALIFIGSCDEYDARQCFM